MSLAENDPAGLLYVIPVGESEIVLNTFTSTGPATTVTAPARQRARATRETPTRRTRDIACSSFSISVGEVSSRLACRSRTRLGLRLPGKLLPEPEWERYARV